MQRGQVEKTEKTQQMWEIWLSIGVILGLYRGYTGIMENKKETTI